MRVLEVAPAWFPVPPERYGGIELVLSGLTDGLVAAGHEVTLVAAAGSSTAARLLTLEDPLPSELLGDAYVELPHVLLAYRSVDDVDLVHDHTALGAALGSMVASTPVVHTLHGEWTETVVRLCRALGDRVTLVAISHDQARRAPSDLSIARVVHNGIPFERYRFHDVPDPDGHFAFLGRAGTDKGADAAVAVARRLGRPLRLGIKVNEPDEREWWRDVLEPLVRDADDVQVVLDATHDEKLDLLAGATALLCPLRWDEPFGLMMVEASACGTPVVAWARGAAPEVVVDGETGLLVAPDDLDGLCEAALAASSLDRDTCRSVGGRRFSAEIMVRAYEVVFDEVLDQRRGPTVGRRRHGRQGDHRQRVSRATA